MAQSPAAVKVSAHSQINVRIPSVAIITLGDNQSKSISYRSSTDLQKIVKPEITSMIKVLSNQKWSVNIAKEEDLSDINFPVNHLSKPDHTAPDHSPQSSFTIIYVATLN
ncbi:hypothetical protein WG906_02525 [Pedobacter sp. P351]|uniref:hypothetical protein n=1 Tax=Pedobacter superstes TaxID=3133441 RepID=UPI0030A76500